MKNLYRLNNLLILVLLLFVNVFTEEKSSVIKKSRKEISLSGIWKVTSINGDSKEIKLPSSNHVKGKFIYEREINYSFNNSNIYSLDLQGVNYQCDVFINEKFIGVAEGYYSNSIIEIPTNLLLNNKPNKIKFIISNEFNEQSIPEHDLYNSIKNFNGVTRKIAIIETPGIWLDNPVIKIQSLRKDKAELLVSVHINKLKNITKKKTQLSLLVEDSLNSKPIFDEEVNFILADSIISFKVIINNPKLWELNYPFRYSFSFKLNYETDSLTVNDDINILFAIKEFKIAGKNFILNNQPFIVKGVTHHQLSQNSDFEITNEQLREDVKWIKEVGFNTIQTEYVTPSNELIALCDEYGLLLFHALPLTDIPSKYFSQKQFEDELFRTVQHNNKINYLQNYISMFMIGSGITFENNIIAKQMDRISVETGNKIGLILNRNEANSLNSRTPIFVNYSKKDTAGLINEIDRFKSVNSSPFLLYGIGFSAEWNDHNGYLSKHSEEYQAKNLQDIVYKLNKMSTSFILKSFSDYEMEYPTTLSSEKFLKYNLSGLLTSDRKEKMGGQIIRNILSKQPKTNIFKGSYPTFATLFYTILSVIGLIVVAWLLSVNQRMYSQLSRSLFHLKNYLDDILNGEFTSLSHSLIILFIITFPMAILVSSLISHLFRTEIFDKFYHIGVATIDSRLSGISTFNNPIELFLTIWIKIILLTLLSAIFTFIIYKLLRTRISFIKNFTINSWIRTPTIYLLILATFMPRLYDSTIYVVITISIIIFLIIWNEVRIVRSISILSEKPIIKILQWYSVIAIVYLSGFYFYNPQIVNTSIRIAHFLVNIYPYY
ncbi:MAG: hypothetical protein EXR24_01680 [Ignavibacteria bacterium]|nr:hypothetical protein [Bacteroidota bacterium]MSQ45678.1 hypothetical protein [Ignavibacteria bacterium]